MKRKVIFMGGKTAVISLPSPWIKKYGIHKGDELDLEEIDSDILIKNTKRSCSIKKSIDFREISENRLIWRCIPSAYISGADEIEVMFKDDKQKELIEKCVGTMIGLGIVDEKDNYLKIKDITGNETEFEPVLRRIFLIAISLSKEAIIPLKESNFQKLWELKERDYRLNSNAFFCLRYINKNKIKDQTIAPMIYLLENMSDKFADTYEYIYENKLKVGKQFVALFEEATKIVEFLHEMYYCTKNEELLKQLEILYKQCKDYETVSREAMIKLNKEESVALSYTNMAISLIQDAVTLLVPE